MSTEHPSRFKRFTNWFDPRCKQVGLNFWHYLISLPFLFTLILVGIGFGAGWFVHGVVYNRAYFASHYRYPGLKTPPPGVNAPIRDVRKVGLPAVVGITTARYPAVGDQGPIGACAAWASAWALSYEYRMAHPGSYIRLSPRYLYDHYSDTYAGGQDAGSWPDQDLELSGSSGTPRFKQLPEPPYQIDNPIPTTDANGASLAQDAAALKVPIQFHYISGFAQGAGQGAVDGIRSALYGTNGTDGHPVFIAFGVYPEYDNATQQPLIVSPTAGETSRGGHENVLLRCDDTKVFPDGTVGGCLTQNQWTKAWGANGRAWFSYDFIRRYSFGLEYITLGASAPHAGKKPAWDTGMTHTPSAAPKVNPSAVKSGGGWYVDNIYARDRNLKLSPIINAVGDHFNLWPVGLASTLGAECALYTTSPTCDRYGGWPDWSHGACQVSVQTAGGFGVGYGNEGSDSYVKQYENNPWSCIALAAKVMRSYIAYTGIGYPYAETAWNCGPGNPTWFFYNPTGQCGVNFQHYLGWYQWALTKQWRG